MGHRLRQVRKLQGIALPQGLLLELDSLTSKGRYKTAPRITRVLGHQFAEAPVPTPQIVVARRRVLTRGTTGTASAQPCTQGLYLARGSGKPVPVVPAHNDGVQRHSAGAMEQGSYTTPRILLSHRPLQRPSSGVTILRSTRARPARDNRPM